MGRGRDSQEKSGALRVAALVTEESSSRADIDWRIATPFQAAAEAGEPWRICTYETELAEAARYDVVVLGKITPAGTGNVAFYQEMLGQLREHGARIVLDLDDDCLSDAWLEQLEESRISGWKTPEELDEARSMTLLAIGAMDAITVSTQPLAALVRQWTLNPVYVVPNALDLGRFLGVLAFQLRPFETLEGITTIGWSGTQRPERDLEPMAEAWGRIAARHRDRVRFVCAGFVPECVFQAVPEDQIIYPAWAPIPMYAQSMAVDIGCCPLEANAFNECKSPIKAIEYGAAGAAVVASPTVYGHIIRDAYNGLLATTADEWTQALEAFLWQREQRLGMAHALSSRVERCHDIQTNWGNWQRAYNQIAGAR